MRGFGFLVILLAACEPRCRGSDAAHVAASAVTARGAEHQRTAEEFANEGARLQAAGEQTLVPELAAGCFRQAIAQYREAARLKPDLHAAQFGLAACWQRLLRHAATAQERADLRQTIQQQFALAAGCRGADWRTYSAWGSFLVREVYGAAPDDDARREILRQARAVFEKGLNEVTFSGGRAELQVNLATCLVLLGQLTPASGERVVLYQKAVGYFESATKVQSVTNPARVYGAWGLAQFEMAKLTGSRWQVRQAIERLQFSLQKDPANLKTRYDLMCAYAMIDDAEKALQQLRLILRDDANHQFAAMAAHDLDLNSLRRTAEFNALFPPESATSSAPPVAATPPPISGR